MASKTLRRNRPIDKLAKLQEENEEMEQLLLQAELQLNKVELSRMESKGQQENASNWSQGTFMLGGFGGVALLALGIKGGLSAVSDSASTSGQRSGLSGVLMSMAEEGAADASTTRREVLSKVAGASALLGAASANALTDYANLPYLGGSKEIDVNNANVRVYAKLPGMYPGAAGKIVTKGPFKDKGDLYSKCNFSSAESAAVKKYESRFLFLEPSAEYVIDRINNGLYR